MSSSNVTYSIFTNRDKTSTQVCYNKTTTHGSTLWRQNSLEQTLPSFVLQLALILSLNRIFLFLSEFCNVPRIVPNIFTGFLLGPSVLGKWKYFYQSVFPFNSLLPLETVGALTLVYYVFLVGLEVDLKGIKRCYFNKKAMIVTFTGIFFTLPIGMLLYYLLVTDMGHKKLSPLETDKHMSGALIWGMTLSCSSEFTEIVKILSDLKLLLTDNGQLAITSILINDLFSWTLFMLGLTQLIYASFVSILIIVVLVLVYVYVIHPFAKWLVKKFSKADREFRVTQVVFLLHVVLVIGLITDGLGSHSITGAFFLGVVIPKGALNNAVQDKVYDFVSAFMMPLFFLMVGERTNIQDLALNTRWLTVVIVIMLALLVKMVFVFAVSRMYRMPLMEGLSLALLMNTKGTMPLIILYSAIDRLELGSQAFVVMLLACWLMTAIAGPVLYIITKTTSKHIGSKRKHIQDTRPDSPLRVLACVHSKHDANAIIDLLKASSPSVRSPIQVLAVELIEMTDRPNSSLVIRDARKPSFRAHSCRVDSVQKNNGDKLGSFDNLSQAIFADKLRIISDYNTMHKDIINLCARRNVNLIVTTLHRQPTYDGLGAGTATARAVNIINRDHASKDEKRLVVENLEKEAPCCLAIFVDREFGGENRSKQMRIAMLYLGGADDREALSYAWRMSRNMEVKLTVVRLVWDSPDDEFDELDREYLRAFVYQTNDTPTVRYLEKVVKDEKETVRLLNRIGNKGFDLYIIGRGHGRKMPLAQTLDPVLDEPVFGPLGDTLTDLNSAAKTSILIFQKQAESNDSKKHEYNASATSLQFLDSVMDQQQQVYTPAVSFGPNFR
ncbi:cation/H(+) antiporter 15-like isoform X1 [Trifolium pratense]|uniref:cation/H(+) antiporter 15-like isoform X1 n=2 Tax=Trifolium pratense TaxID=57577 RepID=UPI001E6968AA|nr:cation/H(+) antiporter 15-like isoform X1 [Trifolium pratense]